MEGKKSSDLLEHVEEIGIYPKVYKYDPEKYVGDLLTLPFLMSYIESNPDFRKNPVGFVQKCNDHQLDINRFAKSEIYANSSDESTANEIKKGTPPEPELTIPDRWPSLYSSLSIQPPNLIPAQPLPLVTYCYNRSLLKQSSVGEGYITDENGMKYTDQARYEDDIDNDNDSFPFSQKIKQN
ncbi:hypothetical protein NPIL_101091 [Nephila pilipes]|uniref:Uncharacterized protein n=1 Tax=Nephila pilipes TaxID=299642 RepID=A0A8X6QU39_NEPPI|nr:hypothetical protein NPIL_101091 [Nephila pilipes]